MGDILETGDYNAIRVKLGVTTDDLSDADIDTIGLLPVAEGMIKKAVTNYASLSAPDDVLLEGATVALCAALAVRKLEMQRSQAFKEGDYSESETKADWAAKREELLLESQALLNLITPVTPRTRPTIFLAVGPTSSGASWASEINQWAARVRPALLNWLDDQFHIDSWRLAP